MGCHVHACVGMAFEITSVHVEHKEVVILKMKREEQTSGNAYIYQRTEKGIFRFGVHTEVNKILFRDINKLVFWKN